MLKISVANVDYLGTEDKPAGLPGHVGSQSDMVTYMNAMTPKWFVVES